MDIDPPIIFYCLFCICFMYFAIRGFLNGSAGEEFACNAGDAEDTREWLPTSAQFSHSVFATPWTAAHQASLSITNSWSLLKLTSIELMMPSNHLILCRPLLFLPSIFPASGSFPMSQLFAWGGQNIGVSASASVLPKNIQDWFPLGWTGWISLKSKGVSRVFSNTTVQKHQFFCAQLSL